MVDPRIIDKLDSMVVSERIEAIKALAKMKDREALIYLAEVVRDDTDPEVRELARKAGIYIKKNTAEMPAVGLADDRPGKSGRVAASASAQALVPEHDEDEEIEVAPPLPSEIQVSQADIDRAQGYMDQAMSMSVRKNNQRAADLMSRALQTNPRLIYDDYAKSLAANITGLPGDEAMKRLAPSAAALRKRSTKRLRQRTAVSHSSPVQTTFAVLTIVAAVVVLVGYMMLPWVDIWGYSDPSIEAELVALTGDNSFNGATVRDSVEIGMKTGFDAQMQALGGEFGIQDRAMLDRLSQLILDYVLGLNLSPSGMDTTNYTLGFQNVFQVLGVFDGLEPTLREGVTIMGFSKDDANAMIDQLGDVNGEVEATADEIGMPLKFTPDPPDYTYILVPIVALSGLAMGLLVMMQPTIMKWSVIMMIGLVGMIPLVYFYISGFNHLVEGTFDLLLSMVVTGLGAADASGLGINQLQLDQLNEIAGVSSLTDLGSLLSGSVNSAQLAAEVPKSELLGLGYYVTAIGMILMLILPLVAMLFIPETKEEPQPAADSLGL